MNNITHPKIYDWIKPNRQYFDLSDYKRDDMHDDAKKKTLDVLKMSSTVVV